ncbi:MAG: alanine--tRNA ligase [Clostridia bacterium]|nr:alanine--tRNA ligase [Clostridia bacterium]
MKWTGLNDLREAYLSFFESKGHLRLPSFSLVPNNDKSLLLINSGMAPMKKYFTGEVTPPRNRVTTCQKCIRTPDIERVGITARHGTYFEMLGNFSFGDYFKHEAQPWAWEFLTKTLEIPAERLWCSVYEDDDEAADIWVKEVGVDPTHIVRLGKEDNFWEHGQGPCGPCSEIYFDRGEEYGCGKPTCGVGCDCDRYMEVWNNVFSQFNNDGNGNYTELDQKNIDTGMGLERLACVMQGVDNLFLVDTVQNIMKHISKIAGKTYGDNEKDDISLRVITDHIRSTTFMIGDGVMPSNEGRGYVLRRLLRRAARHGKLLGIDRPFLAEVCDTVIGENRNCYPELAEKQDFIKNVISNEEENFYKTIDQGLAILNTFIEKADTTVLSGDDAFKLNDTYGFPLDLTREILAEKGMTVDEERFQALLTEQKNRARAARKQSDTDAWAGTADLFEDVPATKFVGYTDMTANAQVLAIAKAGERVEAAEEGDDVIIVLNTTPFYAESGGQIGDKGTITVNGAEIVVTDTKKNTQAVFMHHAVVKSGELNVGNDVVASVDTARRQSIMRNHTAAHLLQAALRSVLGTHVEQAGQLVNADRVRFDFTHFSAMKPEEVEAVEAMVNEKIMEGITVTMEEMAIEEAKKLGAMALFGEKYGDIVRVVTAGDFSREFCGGTHVDNASKLGMFKIVSESGVAAGVRRIEAVTGTGVLALLNENLRTLNETAAILKANNVADLTAKATQVMAESKEKDRVIEALNAKIAANSVNDLANNAVMVGDIKVVAAKVEGADSGALRTMCDKMRDSAGDAAVVSVLAGVADGKGTLACAVTKSAQAKGLKAGVLVKAVAQVAGGNGGGKPDFAMAGVKDMAKIDEAISAVAGIVEAQLG